MAQISESRFSLLKIEDDDDGDDKNGEKKKAPANKNNDQQGGAKKKNKKKKKAEQQQQTEELKSLAFARPGSSKQSSQSGGRHRGSSHAEAPESQWNEWVKADKNYAAESYEKDLEQALLMSKMEFEEKKESRQSGRGSELPAEDSRKEKKKKKKDKPQTMSLEEFNTGKSLQSEEQLSTPSSSKPQLPARAEADPEFFSHVEGDVDKILRKEKIQEEYQKLIIGDLQILQGEKMVQSLISNRILSQFAADRMMESKHNSEIAKKDKEISFLKATVKKLEEEFKQVKKRNKQLCVILAQGEMKEKAEVLMQVQQLTEVKDELTQQVQELTGELEKERSKVHSLKSELDKIKGHGTKHSGK